jgi:hypothetical protein
MSFDFLEAKANIVFYLKMNRMTRLSIGNNEAAIVMTVQIPGPIKAHTMLLPVGFWERTLLFHSHYSVRWFI